MSCDVLQHITKRAKSEADTWERSLVRCFSYFVANINCRFYFFNLKKSAAEAHRLLVETYGEAALSERSCRDWFQKFKNGGFDIEDKEHSGRPKVYEDPELESLLGQDSCQTQEEQYDGQYFK